MAQRKKWGDMEIRIPTPRPRGLEGKTLKLWVNSLTLK